jgi:large subunit ribosomal protein L18
VGKKTAAKTVSRLKRKMRVRAHVRGTEERPRLSVFRSNKHIYAQVINDRDGKTLVAASSLSPEFKATEGTKSGKEAALAVGELVARKAIEKGVDVVVFDRNGFIYRKNGLIATLAEGARKGGLKF